MIVDQHVHLENGPHTPDDYPREWLERFLETARRRGVDRIGLVEHGYRFLEADGLLPLPWAEARCHHRVERYFSFVERMRQEGLPVAAGIEMDYWPGHEEGIRRFLDRHPWDFVLGSVHFVGEFGVDLDPSPEVWQERGETPIWEGYFALSERAVQSGLFDVLTHPDLPKLFGRRQPSGLEHWFPRLAEALRRADMAIECNSKGLRRPIGELYPVVEYLRATRDAGVPLSLGSDAHEPESVGQDFDRARDWARRAGYAEAVHFLGRRRIVGPLERSAPDFG